MPFVYTKEKIPEKDKDKNFVSHDDYIQLEIKLAQTQRLIGANLPSLMRGLQYLFDNNKSINFNEEEYKRTIADKDKQIELATCYITTLLPLKPNYQLAREWLKRNKIDYSKPKKK